MRNMAVDSSGSRKPPASPMATTFLSQSLSRFPAANRIGFVASASGLPSRFFSTKARAIDEQISRYRRAAFQADAFHESALAVLLHFDDLALDAPRAAALGVVAQVSRVQTRIELIGIDDVGQRRVRWCIGRRHQKSALRPSQRADRVGAAVLRQAELPGLEPVLVEVEEAETSADGAESMYIRV